MVVDTTFWRGKRVFITGHTGFKGSWLSLWLQQLGAEVTGYALSSATTPNLFTLGQVAAGMTSIEGDIRDAPALAAALQHSQPEIVLHLAAQPLVRLSYKEPVETFSTNIMGTVHLLEAVRSLPAVRAMVVVTSDKCYENREWVWGYRENEAMGGADPYSSSKGCAELVSAAYRSSFLRTLGIALATARAGNVIGGGDWSPDRLVPDLLNAINQGQPLTIRHPSAVRPWQHVLEPLAGYLRLAEKLYLHGDEFAAGWNFGPAPDDVQPVSWLIEKLAGYCGKPLNVQTPAEAQPHEAHLLSLDSTKARTLLGWAPRWPLAKALQRTAEWNQAQQAGEDMQAVTRQQIRDYQQSQD